MTGILSPAVPAGVLGEGPPQVRFAGDQHQVGDLDPGGEHEPFRVSVRTAAGRERPGLFGAPGPMQGAGLWAESHCRAMSLYVRFSD
jgi:hypothetical protein